MAIETEWLSDDTLWIRGLPPGSSESLRGLSGISDVSEAWGVTAVYLNGDTAPSKLDLEGLIASARPANLARDEEKVIVPVDWSLGADLESIAQQLDLTPSAVIQMVEGAEFTVEAIGFQPGFPYLSGLPEQLCGVPRRVPPRGRVPKGAVAIAEDMVGIYPSVSPGGWNMIGVTTLEMFANDKCTLRVGDKVVFGSEKR
ncbi:MAG: carboxyltransferase domain-containing protein [Fimbriimonadaceae bacterium]|nr:carboxyltransferase domain-containing protein [Fimbriimonadaceae bacterium]